MSSRDSRHIRLDPDHEWPGVQPPPRVLNRGRSNLIRSSVPERTTRPALEEVRGNSPLCGLPGKLSTWDNLRDSSGNDATILESIVGHFRSECDQLHLVASETVGEVVFESDAPPAGYGHRVCLPSSRGGSMDLDYTPPGAFFSCARYSAGSWIDKVFQWGPRGM